MISIKGHIRVLREGKEPLNLTEYSREGFPELTFSSIEKFVEWFDEAKKRAERGEVQIAI